MAVSSELRRSDRFIGDGSQVSFPFEFKVFQNDQIEVVVADTNGDEAILDPELYSVFLSNDQDNNPGGTVTLSTPLLPSYILVILSKVPALQQTVFTNRGGFFPEVLNDCNDLAVILVQQLKEKLERTLSVSATSEKTPEELMKSLFDAADTARDYAERAAESYRRTVFQEALTEQHRLHVDRQKAKVDASEAEVEEDRLEVQQMLVDAQEVNKITVQFLPYLDEWVAVGASIEDVRAVASELQGFPIKSMDLGFIADEAAPIYDNEKSNLKLIGENIELLREVVEKIEVIQSAMDAADRAEDAAYAAEVSAIAAEGSAGEAYESSKSASTSAAEAKVVVERIVEIEKTDYKQIYEKGGS